MSSDSKGSDDLRLIRVSQAMRDIIAQAVIRGLRDVPRGPVTITRVDCARDFREAKVHVSIFLPDTLTPAKKDEKIDEILFAFEDAESDLRRELNSQLRLKNIPKLQFVLDTGIEKMMRVNEKLRIAQEAQGRTEIPKPPTDSGRDDE